MDQLKEHFYIKKSDDHMLAEIHFIGEYDELEIDETDLVKFLVENDVHFGVKQEAINLFLTDRHVESFPLIVAEGELATDGIDGSIVYEQNFNPEMLERTADLNFRDVMQIPAVGKGQKLATLTKPTDGQDGMTVSKEKIEAKKGKPVDIKAGKNVRFNLEDQCFYANLEGQVSLTDRLIQVFATYEINESISMKTGNVDFVGSVVIKGDVPSGFTIKAQGDIKIFGMVEAATVISGSSIYISEGLAGMKRGNLKAAKDIHIGYINQGTAYAKNDIFVENSILHSDTFAGNELISEKGNIIGGTHFAGKGIKAKDIGNRLNTKTEINFGINKSNDQQEQALTLEEKQAQATLIEIDETIKTLASNTDENNPKLRINMLRQRNKRIQIEAKIKDLNGQIKQLRTFLGMEKEAELIVNQYLYPDVVITFGKYEQKIHKDHHRIKMKLDENEIMVYPL